MQICGQSLTKKDKMTDGYGNPLMSSTDKYINKDDLEIIKQLKRNIDVAKFSVRFGALDVERVKAELRAVEAEAKTADAEYQSTTIKIYWKYGLTNKDSVRQSDGLIVKGDLNEEDGKKEQ